MLKNKRFLLAFGPVGLHTAILPAPTSGIDISLQVTLVLLVAAAPIYPQSFPSVWCINLQANNTQFFNPSQVSGHLVNLLNTVRKEVNLSGMFLQNPRHLMN